MRFRQLAGLASVLRMGLLEDLREPMYAPPGLGAARAQGLQLRQRRAGAPPGGGSLPAGSFRQPARPRWPPRSAPPPVGPPAGGPSRRRAPAPAAPPACARRPWLEGIDGQAGSCDNCYKGNGVVPKFDYASPAHFTAQLLPSPASVGLGLPCAGDGQTQPTLSTSSALPKLTPRVPRKGASDQCLIVTAFLPHRTWPNSSTMSSLLSRWRSPAIRVQS